MNTANSQISTGRVNFNQTVAANFIDLAHNQTGGHTINFYTTLPLTI